MGISGSDKALMWAISGRARSGATRSGYVSPQVFVTINGVHYATGRPVESQKVLYNTLRITEHNRSANVASFETCGFTPVGGQTVVVMLGSKNSGRRLFAGQISKVKRIYVGTPTNFSHEVEVFDYTRGLSRLKVSGHFTGSASTIAAALMAGWAPGYTANNIAADLPTVDGGITFTKEDLVDCLNRLSDRVGADWRIDYDKDLHFFLTDTSRQGPQTLTSSLATLRPGLTVTKDTDSVVTRANVEGGGGQALSPVLAGETILPIDAPEWYRDIGGVITSGPQHVEYTGVDYGGGGALVGIAVAPTTAPTVTPAAGAGIDGGAHQWAYSFVTASGETIPSPLATATVGAVAVPSYAPVRSEDSSGAGFGASYYSPGDTVSYQYTYSESLALSPFVNESAPSAATGPHVVSAHATFGSPWAAMQVVEVQHTTDLLVKRINLWVSKNGGAWFLAQTALNNATSGTALMKHGDPGFNPQGTFALPAARGNQATLSGIATGPTGTTARKVYRTAADLSQLKLQSTIANNTGTTLTDSTADGSLGANAPTSDTSGLSVITGQVIPGATSLQTTSSDPFNATGGWAVIGNGQVIRYTGLTGNTLTGIPAAGPGSVVAAISFGSTITAAPQLTGIPASGEGAIVYDILKGDDVNLYVQVDDLPAQEALALLVGGDGVVEEFIQDRRLSYDECVARGTAFLALVKDIHVTVEYDTLDVNTHAGQIIPIDLADTADIEGDFRIQSVTRSDFHPSINPTCHVVASSRLFELADLLQEIRRQRF